MRLDILLRLRQRFDLDVEGEQRMAAKAKSVAHKYLIKREGALATPAQ